MSLVQCILCHGITIICIETIILIRSMQVKDHTTLRYFSYILYRKNKYRTYFEIISYAYIKVVDSLTIYVNKIKHTFQIDLSENFALFELRNTY